MGLRWKAFKYDDHDQIPDFKALKVGDHDDIPYGKQMLMMEIPGRGGKML